MRGKEKTIGTNPFISIFEDSKNQKPTASPSQSQEAQIDPAFQLALRKISGRARLGDFSTQIDTTKLNGYWKEIAIEINSIVKTAKDTEDQSKNRLEQTVDLFFDKAESMERSLNQLTPLSFSKLIEDFRRKTQQLSEKLGSLLKEIRTGVLEPSSPSVVEIPSLDKVALDIAQLDNVSQIIQSIFSQFNILSLNAIIAASNIQETSFSKTAQELKEFMRNAGKSIEEYQTYLSSLKEQAKETNSLMDTVKKYNENLSAHTQQLKKELSEQLLQFETLLSEQAIDLPDATAYQEPEEKNQLIIESVYETIQQLKNNLGSLYENE
jgi:Sec-independent protein translocase protein TatA